MSNLTVILVMFKINNCKLTVITFTDNLINILIFKTNNLYYLHFFNKGVTATFKLKFKINNVIMLLLIRNVLIIVIILMVLHLQFFNKVIKAELITVIIINNTAVLYL